MNIEHLRHSEVVAVIRRGGGQTSLLVVDPETDELFKALGITPTCKHLEGQRTYIYLSATTTLDIQILICNIICDSSILRPSVNFIESRVITSLPSVE